MVNEKQTPINVVSSEKIANKSNITSDFVKASKIQEVQNPNNDEFIFSNLSFFEEGDIDFTPNKEKTVFSDDIDYNTLSFDVSKSPSNSNIDLNKSNNLNYTNDSILSPSNDIAIPSYKLCKDTAQYYDNINKELFANEFSLSYVVRTSFIIGKGEKEKRQHPKS